MKATVQAIGVLVVLHQGGHERGTELRMEARGVVERERGHVDLPAQHRLPLLLRLYQAGAGEHLDLQADVRGLHVARDHLDHFVAHVALAAGELVRGLQGEGVGQRAGGRESGDEAGEQGGNGSECHGFFSGNGYGGSRPW